MNFLNGTHRWPQRITGDFTWVSNLCTIIIDSFEQIFMCLAEQLLQKQGILQQFWLADSPEVPSGHLQGLSASSFRSNCCKNRGFCNSPTVRIEPFRAPGAFWPLFVHGRFLTRRLLGVLRGRVHRPAPINDLHKNDLPQIHGFLWQINSSGWCPATLNRLSRGRWIMDTCSDSVL